MEIVYNISCEFPTCLIDPIWRLFLCPASAHPIPVPQTPISVFLQWWFAIGWLKHTFQTGPKLLMKQFCFNNIFVRFPFQSAMTTVRCAPQTQRANVTLASAMSDTSSILLTRRAKVSVAWLDVTEPDDTLTGARWHASSHLTQSPPAGSSYNATITLFWKMITLLWHF